MNLYQLIIVDDILGFSKDFECRRSLWIPENFTILEICQFLKQECVDDPKAREVMNKMDFYMNPFQSGKVCQLFEQKSCFFGDKRFFWMVLG